MNKLLKFFILISITGLVLAIISMAALGTIGIDLEFYPEKWESQHGSNKNDCGIQPGIYSLIGERIDKDPAYRNPLFPLNFVEKNRRDRPFGYKLQQKGSKISLSFSEDDSNLIVKLLDSENVCLGSTELLRDTHYVCTSKWFKRELPHMDAEPIVGPHGHSVKLRTNNNYLEAKKTNWIAGFVYILPAAVFGTEWMRFKRISDPLQTLSCPNESPKTAEKK